MLGTKDNPFPYGSPLVLEGEYIWRDPDHKWLGRGFLMDGVTVIVPVGAPPIPLKKIGHFAINREGQVTEWNVPEG